MPHRTKTKREVTGMVESVALPLRFLVQHIPLKSTLTYAINPKQLVSEGYHISVHIRFNLGRLLVLLDKKM